MRAVIGWFFPAILVAVVLGAARGMNPRPPVLDGIGLGVFLAAAQAYVSTVSLWLSRKNNVLMMSLWAGGILFRLAFLAFVAFWLRDVPAFGFLATLLTMVLATTACLVVEAETALKG